MIYIITGPQGIGKSTLIQKLRNPEKDLHIDEVVNFKEVSNVLSNIVHPFPGDVYIEMQVGNYNRLIHEVDSFRTDWDVKTIFITS